MKRKQLLKDLLAAGPAAEAPPPESPTPEAVGRRIPSGAVRAMGLDLSRLQEEARRAERLEQEMRNGQAVLEIDPASVDPSFAEDRIARTSDAEYRRLVESIAAAGQQVPILLRPHPDSAGRYQVAYGHRRLAAAAELGIPVRAIIRPLTDAELVIAQGKENAERRNLSFIERAIFAAELEAKGFDRATLHAALAAHPAEMTRYLAVARAIPRWLVRAIGPAPRAGRPRWMALAEAVSAQGALEVAARLAEQPDFRAAPSDARFGLVLAALRQVAPEPAAPALPAVPQGLSFIHIEELEEGTRFTILNSAPSGLAAFLLGRLVELVGEFEARRDGGEG
ncbi:plasmid partitioning protein RepB [Siccirubricoccus sp. KC 17139]|uniref:Plasmid partitioning protein RepB n=1 Tax=Siccirubricoccus soli TaxID=2899147 RepID=A0ABT1DCY8_9PROT|nr:plasmid partitioning protein RepB [Siccirubricoccus soli]MCO6419796.1 plasmid partitioning protein RepB [Siccirubricoccus soli]MCP2685931.1 plasmid partitioning protein RepB [Siccirubricoccus soli]